MKKPKQHPRYTRPCTMEGCTNLARYAGDRCHVHKSNFAPPEREGCKVVEFSRGRIGFRTGEQAASMAVTMTKFPWEK